MEIYIIDVYMKDVKFCRETEKEKMWNEEEKEESNNFVLKLTFVAKLLSWVLVHCLTITRFAKLVLQHF